MLLYEYYTFYEMKAMFSGVFRAEKVHHVLLHSMYLNQNFYETPRTQNPAAVEIQITELATTRRRQFAALILQKLKLKLIPRKLLHYYTTLFHQCRQLLNVVQSSIIIHMRNKITSVISIKILVLKVSPFLFSGTSFP